MFSILYVNDAQIGFHFVVVINSYAAKTVEKAGRRILPHHVPNPARQLSWREGGKGGGGGGEEEGRALLPRLSERRTFGTFPSVCLL